MSMDTKEYAGHESQFSYEILLVFVDTSDKKGHIKSIHPCHSSIVLLPRNIWLLWPKLILLAFFSEFVVAFPLVPCFKGLDFYSAWNYSRFNSTAAFNPFHCQGVPHWRVKSSGVRQSKIYKCHECAYKRVYHWIEVSTFIWPV